MQREVFLLALRVLTRMGNNLKPAGSDINALRRQALQEESALPVDELCCRIVLRILAERRRIRISASLVGFENHEYTELAMLKLTCRTDRLREDFEGGRVTEEQLMPYLSVVRLKEGLSPLDRKVSS